MKHPLNISYSSKNQWLRYAGVLTSTANTNYGARPTAISRRSALVEGFGWDKLMDLFPRDIFAENLHSVFVAVVFTVVYCKCNQKVSY